jgi:hypothetical protein
MTTQTARLSPEQAKTIRLAAHNLATTSEWRGEQSTQSEPNPYAAKYQHDALIKLLDTVDQLYAQAVQDARRQIIAQLGEDNRS